ncbi:MAG: hypothetical protein H7Z41_05465 [Cytophagales bacterium]|nr:hypothetical protein [Armatimonadota bacterium]
MTDFGISAEDLQRLAHLVEENGLSELRYEEGDLRVTLRTASHFRQAATVYASPDTPQTPAEGAGVETEMGREAATPGTATLEANPHLVRIEAPVMGVFYRSPAPGEPSFIEAGDVLEVGQPIGMIEAMKVFSEVLAEMAGTVVEIPAKNGALVQPGDALVLLQEVE